ncbi:RibD family protein [Candidatus Daviesbacteria bacterium]|nr:RibD family protein [Candidatus Daviesbacteria bacterium]
MLYPNLKFPNLPKNRPFFYSNFVQTVDGKVAVKGKGYWPIGSKTDHDVLMELRTYADCLIHGGETARQDGELTLKSLNKRSFQQTRRVLGKSAKLPYYIITRHPQSLKYLNSLGCNVINLPGRIASNLGKEFLGELKEQGYKHVLIEGGPTLLGSFLKENLIDELFLTIAPKIIGGRQNSTKTLVDGILFPSTLIKKLTLLSVKKVKDELFLRYSIKN